MVVVEVVKTEIDMTAAILFIFDSIILIIKIMSKQK